jgi:hypothetical protein
MKKIILLIILILQGVFLTRGQDNGVTATEKQEPITNQNYSRFINMIGGDVLIT